MRGRPRSLPLNSHFAVYRNQTSEHRKNSFVFGVFGSRWGLQANHGTVRKSVISPQPGNQKRIKWISIAYLNKRSFMFKIKFCVFQVTTTSFCKKGIRILNAQPVKIPQFKSLLTRKQARWPHLFIAFFNVHIMNVDYAKFQKKFDSRTVSKELL